jgi:hypothetical protein
MTKRYVDEEITLSVEIRDADGNLTDPASIAFCYRIDRDGPERTAVPVRTGTGTYEVAVTPDRSGNLYGAWTTTAPDKGIPAHLPVFAKDGIAG